MFLLMPALASVNWTRLFWSIFYRNLRLWISGKNVHLFSKEMKKRRITSTPGITRSPGTTETNCPGNMNFYAANCRGIISNCGICLRDHVLKWLCLPFHGKSKVEYKRAAVYSLWKNAWLWKWLCFSRSLLSAWDRDGDPEWEQLWLYVQRFVSCEAIKSLYCKGFTLLDRVPVEKKVCSQPERGKKSHI